MTRSWLYCLGALTALGLAGCIVVVEAPSPTATALPTPFIYTSVPQLTSAASPTVIGIAPTLTLPPPLPSNTPDLIAATPTRPPLATPVGTSRPISITSFAVSPAEIRPGESVTLTWKVMAEQVTIYRLDALGRLSEFFTVPISGTLVVTTSETTRNHIDFVLFANSGQSSAQAFVSAKITCPDTWFFANPPASCPGSPPHYTVMQAEHFEHGFMLWTKWNDVIYILYSDGRSPLWEARANAWFEGMPQSDPSIVPPAGFYQPVRGFGVAWRDEQASAGGRVRDRLGWAVEYEFGVSGAAYQCDSAPKYNTCYITGPDNRVHVLKPERSGWFIWTGPTPSP